MVAVKEDFCHKLGFPWLVMTEGEKFQVKGFWEKFIGARLASLGLGIRG